MNPSVVVYRDAESMALGAAGFFAESARDSVRERGIFTAVLSGGSTPRRLYRRLAGEPFRREIPWELVHLFWGDERTVPPDHGESNFGMARDELITPLGLSPDAVHRMAGEVDPARAAEAYEADLERFFGRGDPPRFDLVMLGMGEDGHTASLFPGSQALSENRRWVAASGVPGRGALRLTLTAPVFNRARRVVFLVSGSTKAAILKETLDGPRDPLRIPAQLVSPDEGELIYCVDSAAGALLGGDGGYEIRKAGTP